MGRKKKSRIVLIAVILSIILYLAGVMSGMYANKIFKAQTDKDIQSLKQETEQNISRIKQATEADLQVLRGYIDFLDTNLKTMQLEQIYIETLSPEEGCNFSEMSLNELVSQLSYYWDKLPFRIEEYERYNTPSSEYLLLKKEYTQLSIRTWILAKNQYTKCRDNLTNVLYFYSATCGVCVKQGEQLDELKRRETALGRDLMVFTVDFNSDDIMVKYLKKYYAINETPALIVNGRIYTGRIFTADEILTGEAK